MYIADFFVRTIFGLRFDSVTIRFVCIVHRDRPASEVQLQHSKIKSVERQQLVAPMAIVICRTERDIKDTIRGLAIFNKCKAAKLMV